MKHVQKILAMVLVIGFPFGAESLGAQRHGTTETFHIDKAITKGEHRGLANYYRQQAKLYRLEAKNHDRMKIVYSNAHLHYGGSENVFKEHCTELSNLALQTAEQYDALAKEEDELGDR